MFRIIFSLFILLVTLSLPLFAQAGSITASGSETLDTEALAKKNIPVTVAYETTTSEDTTPVYQIQIQWGALKFTYQKITSQVWDPSSLSYTGTSTKYKWVCPTDNGTRNDQVIVTNRSNRALTCSLSLDKNTADAVSNVTIGLENGSYRLDSAVGKAESDLPQEATTVSVSGEYTGASTAYAGYLHINVTPEDSE
jgi:hypothetical protein